jgi:serine protease
MVARKRFRCIGLVLLVFILVSATIPVVAAPSSSAPGTAPFVEGEVLVKVAPGVAAAEVARTVGGTVVDRIGDGSILVLKVRDGAVPAAVQALNGRAGVVFAEPNWLRQLHEAPNDTGYGLKWDLHNDGTLSYGGKTATADADMDWQEAYTFLGSGFSGSAVVAVIDTGIDAGHPDLDGKIVAGYDYLDGDSNPADTYGHGTHVAGIALAETNNNTGTAGVGYSPNIKVMPLRVCDESGCPTTAIVNAIYHAADHGANVINLSLGGRIGSTAEETAINYAWEHGLVIAASSGNDGARKVSYPAAFVNCIAVGSTNWNDVLAKYSNKGSALDVVAPGGEMSALHDPGGIYSTMPIYDVYLTTQYGYSKNYDQLQGTSMAAPQVAGLAGLLFAMNVADANGNGRTNDEVRQIIEGTVDDLGATGWDQSYGWGRINVYSAVQAAGGGGGENQPPTAGFTYTTSDLTATFTDTSTDSDGSVVSWIWDFGDGTTSTAQNPSHTYAAGGTYSVILTVTDDDDATGSASQNVTVSSGTTNNPPTASFTFTTSDLTASFTDASTDSDGTIVSWSWDFGDGATSTAQNPSHTYAADGTYTVNLTVTDDDGATGTTSQQVTVSSGGTSDFTLTATGYKVRGRQTVDLAWSGATSTNVDVYRNGSVVATTANDGAYTDSDAVADFLIDVAPVFEGPLQHGFGHAVFQMPHHVGHQPVALRIVHDLAHQGAGLAEIVVVLALGVGGADELAAGTPDGLLGIPLRVGLGAAL